MNVEIALSLGVGISGVLSASLRGAGSISMYFALLEATEDIVPGAPRHVVIHRLTGDGAKRDLLAPLWSGDKKRVLNAVHHAFALRDVEQGSDL